MFFGAFDDFTEKDVEFKGRVLADFTGFHDNKITVTFGEQKRDYKAAVGFAILDSKNNRIWYSEAEIKEETYLLNISSFNFLSFNSIPMRYKLYVVFDNESKLVFCRLYSKPIKDAYLATGDKALLYMEAVAEKKYNNTDVSFIPNCTTSGYLGFILIRKSSLLNYILKNTVESFEVKDGHFCFTVRIKKFRSCDNVGVTLRSAFTDEVNYYDVEPESRIDGGNYFELRFRFSRNFLQLDRPDRLTVCSYYEIDGYRYLVSVRTKDEELSQKITRMCYDEDSRENALPMEFTFRSPFCMLKFPNVLTHIGHKITEENTPRKILFSPEFVASRIVAADFLPNKGSYIFRLKMNIEKFDDFSIFIHSNKSKEKIILDVASYDKKKREIEVDFSAIRGNIEDFTARNYLVCFAFSYKGSMYAVKLRFSEHRPAENDTKEIIPNKYFESVATFIVKDTYVSIIPFYSASGYFYVRVQDRLFNYVDDVTVPLEKLTINNKILNVTVDITDNEKNFTGFALSYFYRKSEDKRVYFVKGDLLAKGDRTILKAKIDLSKFEFQRIRWMFYAVFMEGEIPYFANITAKEEDTEAIKIPWQLLLSSNCYKIPAEQGTDVFFPYTTKSNTTAFMMREENISDERSFKWKELFALAKYKLLKSHYRKKKIIIMYEKNGNCAQDNGYQLFRYCMDNNVEKRLGAHIYYVIDKNSPHYERVAMYRKRLLNFMSFKHMVYMVASRLLVSSDTRPHSYIWRANNSAILNIINNKKFFFLQHGVTAFKRNDNVMGKNNTVPFIRYVTTSKAEKEIIHKYFNYDYDEICDIGFTRWDYLEDKSQGTNEVLFMPTWRNWLDEVEDSLFLESDYFKEYSEMIKSKRLHDILEKYDVTVNFFVHPKFRTYLDKFESNDRIKIVEDDVPLNELIMRCKLLVTDYSSVSWDAYYMGKPVLFYQFDYDMYSNIHGSYIDMKTELFGDRSTTLDGFCDDFERAAKSGFKLPHKYSLMRDRSFSHIDKQNCARTVQEIRKIKW
ncbi:MAG: CDP-glycerol glycerophosphotransferase family protein [Ruminococcus sp.]|nr:CDP-glycerol glycerophosphotransferase family protein [Ruminococcus sp.]